MFIDSHCHLTYEPLVSNISKIIEDCEKSSVTKLLTIGTNIQSSVKCIEISKEYQNIYSSVGIHPVEAHIESDKKDQVQKLYQSSDKNIGYGETGLDFYYSSEEKKCQIDLFETHIKFAVEDNSTVIVHTRDAEDETLSILKEHTKNSNLRVLIHCFTGSMQFAKSLLNIGCYISFSGIITFKNTIEIQEVAKYTPIDRILVETDSPFLSPHPLRGKKNFPENVVLVAEKLAKLKNTTISEIGKKTSDNFLNVFNL
ncbi:TatD family hydrolase [Pelagibacteraceae bacterium]|nr:TatD family hydrolase [Pelagibacteraceae bacterium]